MCVPVNVWCVNAVREYVPLPCVSIRAFVDHDRMYGCVQNECLHMLVVVLWCVLGAHEDVLACICLLDGRCVRVDAVQAAVVGTVWASLGFPSLGGCSPSW